MIGLVWRNVTCNTCPGKSPRVGIWICWAALFGTSTAWSQKTYKNILTYQWWKRRVCILETAQIWPWLSVSGTEL